MIKHRCIGVVSYPDGDLQSVCINRGKVEFQLLPFGDERHYIPRPTIGTTKEPVK